MIYINNFVNEFIIIVIIKYNDFDGKKWWKFFYYNLIDCILYVNIGNIWFCKSSCLGKLVLNNILLIILVKIDY